MDQYLRSRVAKKAGLFLKQAQAVPPTPTPAPAPGAPPAPGAAPMPGVPKGPAAAPKPPMPPVPMPGAPKPREEIEQGMEKDIKKQKQQEMKIEELSDKVTTMSEQMDKAIKSIDNLVNVLQKGKGETTEFEHKFDELKEEEEEGDKSSSTFGLDKPTESLIRSKEGSMNTAEKLREARKNRLNAEKLVFEDTEKENKKYKQQVVAPKITKLKDEPKDWEGKYGLKMANLALDLNASKDSWTVVDKTTNQPFFKISPTADTKDQFPTEEFAKQIIKDVAELGLEAAMQKYSAEPFSSDLLKRKDGEPKQPVSSDKIKNLFKRKEGPKSSSPISSKPKSSVPTLGKPKSSAPAMDKPKSSVPGLKPATPGVKHAPVPKMTSSAKCAAEETPAEETAETDPVAAPAAEAAVPVVEKKTEATASEKADFERRFVRAFRLALSAQQKNLADNPLKAAWYDILKGINVPSPEKVIEAAFSRAAAEHFEVTLAKTADYLKLSDESFVELESQIGELETTAPAVADDSEEVDTDAVKAAALRARAARQSLPFSSASETSESLNRAQLIAAALPKPRLHGIKP